MCRRQCAAGGSSAGWQSATPTHHFTLALTLTAPLMFLCAVESLKSNVRDLEKQSLPEMQPKPVH